MNPRELNKELRSTPRALWVQRAQCSQISEPGARLQWNVTPATKVCPHLGRWHSFHSCSVYFGQWSKKLHTRTKPHEVLKCFMLLLFQTSKKVWRYGKSAPQVQRGVWIQENFLRFFLWWYKQLFSLTYLELNSKALSVKNSSSCSWKPHAFSVPGMSHIPFVPSCRLAWSWHHYKYWHWCHQCSLKMSFFKTME